MKKRTAVAVRPAPSVPKKKYELAVRAASAVRSRGKQVAAKRAGTLVGAAAGGLAGYLIKQGRVSPKFTSPAAMAVAGAVLAFVLPETSMGKGKLGAMSAEAGSGLLAVAAFQVGLGNPIIGDDDSVEGWEEDQ